MPLLHVSALYDIAQAHNEQAPAGKARLVNFAGTIVRVLRRLDCDWDLDGIPHDPRLWHVHPTSIRLFQKYNRDVSTSQYPNFCTVVWIADDIPSQTCTTNGNEACLHTRKRKRSFESGDCLSSSLPYSVLLGRATQAVDIEEQAKEIVVIDSSDEDDRMSCIEDDGSSSNDRRLIIARNASKRQKQQKAPNINRCVAMVLPWVDSDFQQLRMEQGGIVLRPGVRVEVQRAVLHVNTQRELLACVFNSRTTLHTVDQQLSPQLPIPNPTSQGQSPAFHGLAQGSSFDACKSNDGERGIGDRRSMAIVNEIKVVDAQTKAFHFHYLADLYNTLASSSFCFPMASSAVPTEGPSSTLTTTSERSDAHSEASTLAPPPLPFSIQRVHRFLCWIISLKYIHLRSVCVECGQAFKVDRCEFGCTTIAANGSTPTLSSSAFAFSHFGKWRVCARASCVVSDGTASAVVHLDQEADVWTLLRLYPPYSGGRGGSDDDDRMTKLLRLLVRVGELVYNGPSESNYSSTRMTTGSFSSGSSSSSSNQQRQHQPQNSFNNNHDRSERARIEREFWSSICEQAVSPSRRERLVLYARIKDLSPKHALHHSSVKKESVSFAARSGVGRMYKGRFWLGNQSVTTVFHARLNLECLALDTLANSSPGHQLTSSRKATVIESRMLLNKLLNKQ
ncbi:hypothetical protein BGW42_006112 [Actinomortierella wolfii]|nr:hypothetical protein BGW42_006112 [Actinomortierella wolfii]